MSREKLRRVMRGDYRDLKAPSRPQTPVAAHARAASTSTAPKPKTPFAPSAPFAPASASTPQPPATAAVPGGGSSASSSLPAGQLGRLPAPPPVPGQPTPPAPPPPEWLVDALKELEMQYPNGDRFEAIMKYSYLDPVSELPIQQPNDPHEGVKYVWLPRIRCLDCTNKLYTPGPEMTAGKFEAHLKFSGHTEKVKARLASQKDGAFAS